DAVDLPGDFPVDVHARAHHGQVGAQLESGTHRHRRMDAVGTRFVVAGGDHAALIGRAADRQRPAGQTRIVAHLDGGVEAIAVDVDDFSLRRNSLIFQAIYL